MSSTAALTLRAARYVLRRTLQNSNITQFAVGGNGILTAQETFYTQGINPIRLSVDSSGTYLYVLDHDAPLDAALRRTGPASMPSPPPLAATLRSSRSTRHGPPATGRECPGYVGQRRGAALLPGSGQTHRFPVDHFNLFILSGTPTSGDSVFPYTYSSTNGQLTISQNSSQPLTGEPQTSSNPGGLVQNATAIVSAGGIIYVLDNEPITANGTTYPADSAFHRGTNGALQAHTGGIIPDDAAQSNRFT